MPAFTNNKYLNDLLETLITDYETEINYTPIIIDIDPEKITPEDIPTLLNFVNETRKRLFIFTISDDETNSNILALSANRAVLNQTAKTILQSTSTEPKINPLKQALGTSSSVVRAGIQIQKSFALPAQQKASKKEQIDTIEHQPLPDITLIPLKLAELPVLENQLGVLGIQSLHDLAAKKINDHAHAFTDGIVPGNLPRGFYIDQDKHALCYTNNPARLPSALAAKLEMPAPVRLPTPEQITALMPDTTPERVGKLLNTGNLKEQQSALIKALPAHKKEVASFLQSLEPTEQTFLVPLLTKFFILGGEAHTCLFTLLIKNCMSKNISLDFLKSPVAEDAFLSPRGIKNLQKLLQLPAEQREWWNTLTSSHLDNIEHAFDFNTFFEAYTQIFLPRIAEKNLTLPNPCPIEHKGHLLTTLNRVLDVIENAANPQEQCRALGGLNWGPTGAHYAMTNAPENVRMHQVAACMELENPEDMDTNPEATFKQLDDSSHSVTPWIYRYMGQHWKSDIRLTDINTQLEKIAQLTTWTAVEKNRLRFILGSAFSDKSPLTVSSWKLSLQNVIDILNPLDTLDRTTLLDALSRSFQFKPSPSLQQIHSLMEQLLELKQTFPDKNFKDDLVIPLVTSLEKEGFELLNTLQERIEKTQAETDDERYALTAQSSFFSMLQNIRHTTTIPFVRMLAALNEAEYTQTAIDDLNIAFNNVLSKKGNTFSEVITGLLSQINISKSEALPTAEHIINLLNTLADSTTTLPVELLTQEKQEVWLKDLIMDQNLLPKCVLGKGDISKLDDLIVDAMADAVKKRSAVLKIDKLKDTLKKHLGNSMVPDQLRDQLDRELMPLFDALADLVNLLQSPNPSFNEVMQKLRFFEDTKPLLLNGEYSLGPLVGKSKGEYLLSFLLTGKRKEDKDGNAEELTSNFFATLLGKVHGIIAGGINEFFEDKENKAKVKDLDAKTVFSWLNTFNATHSIVFLFQEELVEKKVLPALKKALLQLNTQDKDFELSILNAASDMPKAATADVTLTEYKDKIGTISSYLNLLIDLKEKLPANQFRNIYKQLQTGALARLNYNQKQVFINKLLVANADSLDLYLKLTSNVLEENPDADDKALDRAIDGLVALFELSDLEPDTQTMFFKMSMSHNLKYPSPFPLAALNELKKSALPDDTKTIILKQIIQILSRMGATDSPELIKNIVQQTQLFLTNNPTQTQLCIELLKHVSTDNLSRDLNVYQTILTQLTGLNEKNRNNMATILTGFATRKKDVTVNLPLLLDITKGLSRHLPADVERVLQLFKTPPFPIAQMMNSALMNHGPEKLQAYCQNFDTNPFATSGKLRPLAEQFATDRIQDALLSLQDLMHGVNLSHPLQMQLARQLTYIETLGYTDPLNPNDFSTLKKLTAASRKDLQEHTSSLLAQMRAHSIPAEDLEAMQLELLAYMREIYFRTTGLFPNTTQMLMLLLSLQTPDTNLLMSIKTGEGKSLITPMLAVLQWAQGGTVDVCTANSTLLRRDYENSCEPFFTFLGIKSAVIQADSKPQDYQLGGINCSTLEDMSLFRLAAKEAGQEALIQNDDPIHLVLDECDDALLDQTTLYKLVAEHNSDKSDINSAQWIYPLAMEFINTPAFRNTDIDNDAVWDEEEDLEQFRLFLNKEISDKYQGDADKQNVLMASTNTQLRQWIHASCKAAKLIENKHFIVQTMYEKDESGNETNKKMVCVPLVRSTPKGGCIFTDGVQQALQARMLAEKGDQGRYFSIDRDPPVLASQSACGLIQFYQNTHGRLVGISGTPGDTVELNYLGTILGTQAIGVAPFKGDIRKKHPPTFTTTFEDTISAIHTAIDSIKLPITAGSVAIRPGLDDNFETREKIYMDHVQAVEEWNKTQTQPVLLICEDFDEAAKIEKRLDAYKKAGFKIQTVTGKESPLELERIIKQAGYANTITIGTAMLARGIDINPGNHPKGLFVVQAYTDSERINTQVAGRAARNGKPGQWTPIFQVQAPKSWFTRLLCYLSPSYRQKTYQEAVTKLQAEIKLQDSIDRIYTQAVDRAQQTLILQIKSWETLLLELYPNDSRLQYELYQWRETLLSELTHYQESSVTQSNLESSIAQFNNSISKLWNNVREEKWAAKADKAMIFTPEQALRLKYLKQSDLTQEGNIQTALQQKGEALQAGTMALMHQHLDMMILDKAGAVLSYTNPDEETRKNLHLAQSRQLLPNLIGEFCRLYPHALTRLVPEGSDKNPAFSPDARTAMIDTIIKKRNTAMTEREVKEQITAPIVSMYQQALEKASSEDIEKLLTNMAPLILKHASLVDQMPLVKQFQMRGLIVAFCKIHDNSKSADAPELNDLKTSYDNEIMKKLTKYLMAELSWAIESPLPLHAKMERTVAVDAALELYVLAKRVDDSPQDVQKIQALYRAMQQQRLALQDKYLFSMGHTSVRDVINVALSAVETLNTEPFCSKDFQERCHDAVLSEHHMAEFNARLQELSANYDDKKDPIWIHLKNTLETISNRAVKSRTHVIEELYQAVQRFSTYNAYLPYLRSLHTLKAQLEESLEILKKPDGLKQETEASLLSEKAAQFAEILQVDANNVHIQSGSDGIRSYIELQVENAPLQEGFTGYKSTSLDVLEKEKNQLNVMKSRLQDKEQSLVDLSDPQACNVLPATQKEKFKKLFSIKTMLDTLSENLNSPLLKELPEDSQALLINIRTLNQWDWTKQPVILEQFQEIMGEDANPDFIEALKTQSALQLRYDDLQLQKITADKEIIDLEASIVMEEKKLQNCNDKMKVLNFIEQIPVRIEINQIEGKITNLRSQLTKSQDILTQLATCTSELESVNRQLDTTRAKSVVDLTSDATIHIHRHLPEASRKLFDAIKQELNAAEATLEKLSALETKKARYQTRRFYSTNELLQYEASLTEEEANIRKKPASAKLSASNATFFNKDLPDNPGLPGANTSFVI